MLAVASKLALIQWNLGRKAFAKGQPEPAAPTPADWYVGKPISPAAARWLGWHHARLQKEKRNV